MAARSPRGAFLIYISITCLFAGCCLTCNFVLDSPRAVGLSPININNTTGATRMMPGSFNDDSEEEFDLDDLSLGISGLGIKDN